jgi:hypothetical protein
LSYCNIYRDVLCLHYSPMLVPSFVFLSSFWKWFKTTIECGHTCTYFIPSLFWKQNISIAAGSSLGNVIILIIRRRHHNLLRRHYPLIHHLLLLLLHLRYLLPFLQVSSSILLSPKISPWLALYLLFLLLLLPLVLLQ